MKIFLQIASSFFIAGFANAQSLRIGTNSKLIMKGPVNLVVRNAALINNGTLTDSAGTLHFSGHKDTSVSYFGGSSPSSVFNLSINKSGFGTAIKTPVAVQNVLGVYGGTLFPDSNVTLRSDKDLTARVDVVTAGAGIVGKAIVERYYPKRRAWRLVTSPLSATPAIFDTWQNKGVFVAGVNTSVTGPNPTGPGGNGLDASPMNNASMKTWNYTTQQLEPVFNTKVALSPGNSGVADNAGYFLFVRGDRDYNNFYLPNSNNTTLSSNGQLQVGTQQFAAAGTSGALTLIGNPYASPVDFNAITRINLVKRFYIWDPTLNVVGAYVMLDDLDNDGIFTKSINASPQTNQLQSSQAFFVETLVNGTANISFAEASKSNGNNNALFRPGPAPTGTGATQSIRVLLNLKEEDGSVVVGDGTLLECNNIFSDSVDRDDGLKFSNINENIALQRYGRALSAERRPRLTANDTLFFKMNHLVQRRYQLFIEPAAIDDPGLTAWLEDSYLNTTVPVDLYQPSSVEFTVDGNAASSVSNRFRIVFKQSTVLPVTILDIKARSHNRDVVVEWSVTNEINIISYELERSTDGVHFTRIAAQAATGNLAEHQYALVDHEPEPGNNFYRIKYIEGSGQAKYTKVVMVRIDGPAQPLINVFPNPVTNNSIHLQLINFKAGKYHLRILNEAGQLLHERDLQNISPNSKFIVVPPVELPAGNHLLQISGDSNETIIKKIVVSR